MSVRVRLIVGLIALTLALIGAGCNHHNGVTPGNTRPLASVQIIPSDPFPDTPFNVDATSSSDDRGIVRTDLTIRDVGGRVISFQTGVGQVLSLSLSNGQYSATVTVVDGEGEQSSLTINFVVSDCGASPQLVSTSLADAIEGTDYDQFLTLQDGVAPVTVELANGSTLPKDLFMAPSGEIAGVPAAGTAGTYIIRVKVKDSCAVAPRVRDASFSLTIEPSGSGCPPLSFDDPTLPDATHGALYNFTLTTAGGVAPVTIDVASGSLPGGIVLSGANLTGIPTTISTYVFGLRATDACPSGPQVTVKTYSLKVN